MIKYATLFPGGFYSSAFGFFMNEDKWNKLAKEDQDAIMSVSGEALARLAGKAWDATDRAALEEMKKAGIQIHEASPELVKGVQERAKAIEREVDAGAPPPRASTAPRCSPSSARSSSASPPATDGPRAVASQSLRGAAPGSIARWEPPRPFCCSA